MGAQCFIPFLLNHLNPCGGPPKKAHTTLARASWARWDNWLEHIIGSFWPVTWLTPHEIWIQKERFSLGSQTLTQVEQGCMMDMHRHASKTVFPGLTVWPWPTHWMDRCFNYQSVVNHLYSAISIICSVVPALSSPESRLNFSDTQDWKPTLFVANSWLKYLSGSIIAVPAFCKIIHIYASMSSFCQEARPLILPTFKPCLCGLWWVT